MTNLDWIRTADKKDLAEFLEKTVERPCAFCRYGYNYNGCDGSCPDVKIEDWLDERHIVRRDDNEIQSRR